AKAGRNSLRLRGYLAGAPASFSPTRDGVTLQIADRDGQIYCHDIPMRATKRGLKHGVFRFRDRTGARADGLRTVRFKIRKDGSVVFRAKGGKMPFRAPAGDNVDLTLRVGGQCTHTTAALRTRATHSVTRILFPYSASPTARARRGPVSHAGCRAVAHPPLVRADAAGSVAPWYETPGHALAVRLIVDVPPQDGFLGSQPHDQQRTPRRGQGGVVRAWLPRHVGAEEHNVRGIRWGPHPRVHAPRREAAPRGQDPEIPAQGGGCDEREQQPGNLERGGHARHGNPRRLEAERDEERGSGNEA